MIACIHKILFFHLRPAPGCFNPPHERDHRFLGVRLIVILLSQMNFNM